MYSLGKGCDLFFLTPAGYPLSMVSLNGVSSHLISSHLVEDGAVRHQTSEGEKIAALSFSLALRKLFASCHASLRAHRSCFKVSFSDVSSNFGAKGLRS